MPHVLIAAVPNWVAAIQEWERRYVHVQQPFYDEADGVVTLRIPGRDRLMPEPRALIELGTMNAKFKLTIDILANKQGGLTFLWIQPK